MMDVMNEQGLVGADPLPSPGRPASDLPTSSVLMREKAEPKDGFEPTPVWTYVHIRHAAPVGRLLRRHPQRPA